MSFGEFLYLSFSFVVFSFGGLLKKEGERALWVCRVEEHSAGRGWFQFQLVLLEMMVVKPRRRSGCFRKETGFFTMSFLCFAKIRKVERDGLSYGRRVRDW